MANTLVIDSNQNIEKKLIELSKEYLDDDKMKKKRNKVRNQSINSFFNKKTRNITTFC